MVRRNLDDIKIVEPPLNELTNRSSHKRACVTGCGCIVFLIIAVAIGLKIYIGPGPQTLKIVPQNFPADIPIYDRDNIQEITFISGRYKNRGIEVAAFFPKIILSPLLLKLSGQQQTSTDANDKPTTLKSLWQIITTPVGDHKDTIQIEWQNLNTDYDFINSYYKKEMIKNSFNIDQESEGTKLMQFSFTRADGLSGSFYATGRDDGRGTAYAILTVNLPIYNP